MATIESFTGHPTVQATVRDAQTACKRKAKLLWTSPTFGSKLGIDRLQPAAIAKPSQLLGAVFDTARHTLDFDFISQNPDYAHLVAMIDTGDHNWLNFNMKPWSERIVEACGAAEDALVSVIDSRASWRDVTGAPTLFHQIVRISPSDIVCHDFLL